ncbi:hypothetical protein [Haloarchaeobius sp. TZWWS8]|uniref:hypothetical protein n=1 Tax=Haloarchaeobius sp. TZWWS8 TaxID=3446121 RepID=UPI003EBC685E
MGALRAGGVGSGLLAGIFLVTIVLGRLTAADGPETFLAAGFFAAFCLLGLGLFRRVFRT